MYELLYFFIYSIHIANVYKNDSHLEELLYSFDGKFDLISTPSIDQYSMRFPKIDRAMKYAMENAKNSGGIGAAIMSTIVSRLPDSLHSHISINCDKKIEEMFDILFNDEDEQIDIISPYIAYLWGPIIGETIVRFAKDIEHYFSDKKIV